jgi:Tol biopolymer transport system component
MDPAWSPDGRHIAFSSDRDGPSGIYVMNADGSGVRRITDSFGLQPAWSPDGRHIAFKGSYGLSIVNADGGGEPMRLIEDSSFVWSPTWSPDGQSIAFSSERDGNPEVYVINVDGSGLARLTNYPGEDSYPAWSPSPAIIPRPLPATMTPTAVPTSVPYSEEKIVFESERDGNYAIYIMNTDGSGVTRLIGSGSNPAWSPDGARIAFRGVGEISIINSDGRGTAERVVYDWDAWDPTWSVDGQHIAYSAPAEEHDHSSDIFVIDTDGGQPVNLTNHPAEDRDPAWSPDGRQIAFESDRDGDWDGDSSVYIMNADGLGITRLTDSGWDPAWSPDGKHIAFSSGGILIVDADGTGLRRVLEDWDYAWDPTWSPDGQQIAFSSERDGNPEIYVINVDGSGLTRLTNDPGDDGCPAWSP